MPRSYKKKPKRWSEKELQEAFLELEAGKSINATAKKYGMNEGTLRYYLKKTSKGEEQPGSGRQTVLSNEIEEELARCIGTLCQIGFSPTRGEVMDLVAAYLRNNRIIVKKFKDGRPGPDWFNAFMKRNNLSMKKANMISAARKSKTSNPFIILEFYELLDKIIEEKNLNPNQIWNCDESGFPTDLHKCKVVSTKGKTAFKLTCGAGRENITTVAVVSAAGKALDPLVIFPGKNMQSIWRGEGALPETAYGISDTGWMTTEIFVQWFELFRKKVTERPLLLVFDGHLTHVSVQVIKSAREDDITLLKLPPHVTDLLQPLDVTCFGPLKRYWEELLHKWVNENGFNQPINKPIFVSKLGEVWHKGLSPENIKAGFERTGIFPVNKAKYPVERYDKKLYRKYEAWNAAGRPEDVREDLSNPLADTPQKLKHHLNNSSSSTIPAKMTSLSTTPLSIPNQDQSVNTPNASFQGCCCNLAIELGKPPNMTPPPGMKLGPAWALVPANTSTPLQMNKKFEEIILDRIKGPADKPPPKKRRKIDLKAKVITDLEYLTAIQEKEKEFEEKKNKTTVRKKKVTKSNSDGEEDSRPLPLDENDEEAAEEESQDEDEGDDDSDEESHDCLT